MPTANTTRAAPTPAACVPGPPNPLPRDRNPSGQSSGTLLEHVRIQANGRECALFAAGPHYPAHVRHPVGVVALAPNPQLHSIRSNHRNLPSIQGARPPPHLQRKDTAKRALLSRAITSRNPKNDPTRSTTYQTTPNDRARAKRAAGDFFVFGCRLTLPTTFPRARRWGKAKIGIGPLAPE